MKFYQLTPEARRALLVEQGILTQDDAGTLASGALLEETVADGLIENQLGQFALPLGIARDLMVDGTTYQVPMVTEEPSVIAAASNGARIAGRNGGVYTTTKAPLVLGEVVYTDLLDPKAAAKRVNSQEAALKAVAASAHLSIVRRGGGLKRIETVVLAQRFLKISLFIDPKEAMGANIVNTICESVAQKIDEWLGAKALVAILSNQSPTVTTARVTLAPATLATTAAEGLTLAQRIGSLSDLAQVDVARAVTHNKGIMNGVTAAALATGNDTRALSAAVHAYAARSGQYQPLSRWWLEGDVLLGELRLPLPVGSVGGAIGALPMAQLVKRLGQYQDVLTLQRVLASVGLVQNLAALRALVGPGIQQGHMALQANALAMAAGAQGAEVAALSELLQTHQKTLSVAVALLAQLRRNHDDRN